jgi:hypothetical protein
MLCARRESCKNVGWPAVQLLLFIAVAAYDRGLAGGGLMRLLLGLILGALFTIGGAYVLDSRADGVEQRRMVNWDVVGQRMDQLTAELQVLWNNFTRQITGPP